MSQFWHAHWAEDSFKSTRLQNWEVPRWHAEWPKRHCTTTKFVAYDNGRLYATCKPSKIIWSNFKGTWELPLKIDRHTAEKLSKSTENKKAIWKIRNKQYHDTCTKVNVQCLTCKDFIGNSNKNKNEIELKKVETQDENEIKKSQTEDDTKLKNKLNYTMYVVKNKKI